MRSGFTLVELALVVLIIGILAAAAVPQYADTMSRCRVDAAAKRIARDLEYARNYAQTHSASQSVQFTLSTSSYTLPGVKDMSHPSATFTVSLQDEPYRSSLVSVKFDQSGNIDAEDYVIVFNGFGFPDSGGSAVVQSGRYQKTVTVDGATGQITIQ